LCHLLPQGSVPKSGLGGLGGTGRRWGSPDTPGEGTCRKPTWRGWTSEDDGIHIADAGEHETRPPMGDLRPRCCARRMQCFRRGKRVTWRDRRDGWWRGWGRGGWQAPQQPRYFRRHRRCPLRRGHVARNGAFLHACVRRGSRAAGRATGLSARDGGFGPRAFSGEPASLRLLQATGDSPLLSPEPSSYHAVHLKSLSSCLLGLLQPLQTRCFSDGFPLTASQFACSRSTIRAPTPRLRLDPSSRQRFPP